ncbi:hypothetical protein GCM10027290_23650 [Micromonospora sonneratiae]
MRGRLDPYLTAGAGTRRRTPYSTSQVTADCRPGCALVTTVRRHASDGTVKRFGRDYHGIRRIRYDQVILAAKIHTSLWSDLR